MEKTVLKTKGAVLLKVTTTSAPKGLIIKVTTTSAPKGLIKVTNTSALLPVNQHTFECVQEVVNGVFVEMKGLLVVFSIVSICSLLH